MFNRVSSLMLECAMALNIALVGCVENEGLITWLGSPDSVESANCEEKTNCDKKTNCEEKTNCQKQASGEDQADESSSTVDALDAPGGSRNTTHSPKPWKQTNSSHRRARSRFAHPIRIYFPTQEKTDTMDAPDFETIKRTLIASNWLGQGDNAGRTLSFDVSGTYRLTYLRSNGTTGVVNQGNFELTTDETNKPILHLSETGDPIGWVTYIALVENELRLLEPTDSEPYMLFVRQSDEPTI